MKLLGWRKTVSGTLRGFVSVSFTVENGHSLRAAGLFCVLSMSGDRLRLVRWKPQIKNTLRGFATVELPIGLLIIECPVHLSTNGRLWAALPARPQIDRDGRHRRDVNGKAAWLPILEWRSPKLREAFSSRVIELVLAECPEDLR